MKGVFGAVLCLFTVAAFPVGVSAQSMAANGGSTNGRFDGPPAPAPPKTVARDAEGRVTVRAVRLTEGLVIDGRLDEVIYSTVEPITGFLQQEPHEGQPETEKTEAWLFFDDQNVYVSARCWESHPERRVANEMRRDNMTLFQNDHFGVIFDTFHDRRNGFMFYVNAIGGFADSQTTDERESNRDWNTVWWAKTHDFEGGWAVEMKIPFRSLRYRAGDDQIWGVNFRRAVRSKNEMTYLTAIPAAYSRNGLLRLSRAATLVGIAPGRPGLSLEVKPYAVGAVLTDLEQQVSNEVDPKAGLDLKYGLTRSLTLDVTLNTDFAQVEADEQQVNLTRFSLFFPEKRDFFLEGQGIFGFGGVVNHQFDGGPNNTPILFFSRRIGLTDDGLVPITAGARVTGKAGPFSVGALQIRTDDAPAANAVKTDFSVVRIKRDILRRSTIGLIATRRSPSVEGTSPGQNYTLGVDAVLSFFQNLNINSYYAQTTTPGLAGANVSYRAQLDYAGDRYGLQVERLAVGANFNPEVGFVRRGDMIRNFVQARFSPRPASMPSIRKFGYEASLDYITDGRGRRLETQEAQGQFRIEFQSGDEFTVEGSDVYEYLDEPFEITDEISIPVGGYHFKQVRANYRLGPQRRVSGGLNASVGGFYDGDRREAGFRGRIEVTPQFSLEPGLSQNWVDLPYGAFTETLVNLRPTWTISPRMFLAALVQYASGDDLVSSNIRFRWEYTPGSDFFVVYSDGRDTSVRGFPRIQNRTFAVKMAHLLRF